MPTAKGITWCKNHVPFKKKLCDTMEGAKKVAGFTKM
jgi:hypothetical protein